MPPGVTETITNVSGYYFKVTITIPEHSKPASRTLTIRANQPNGLDRELVQTVQQSASTYEFGIRENSGDSLSTSLTYSGWPSSDPLYNRSVRVYSRKMVINSLIGLYLLMWIGLLYLVQVLGLHIR